MGTGEQAEVVTPGNNQKYHIAGAASLAYRTAAAFVAWFSPQRETVLDTQCCTLGSFWPLNGRVKGKSRNRSPGYPSTRPGLWPNIVYENTELVHSRNDYGVRHYSHSLDELFESLRPTYMARRARYFAAEAQVVADLLAEGRRLGAFACDDPEATAHTLLLATNSLLPYSLTARELGKREDVKQKALRIADLLLAGLRPRRTAPDPREKSS